MTRKEAEEILSAFRASTADRADPAFREALELVGKDSDLAAWLARQQEFDAIVIAKLSSIRPPEGLREAVLESLKPIARPPQFWRFGLLAAAAAVLVALFLGQQIVSLRNPSTQFQSFYSDALAMVAVKPMPKLDLETASLEMTQAFIEQHDAPRLGRLPPELRLIATAGCRVFVWRQHLASLTCFRLPSGNLLHLVVIDEKALGDSKMPSGLYSEDRWQMMFQKENGLILMWASEAPIDEWKQLVVET
jgi:hypothetical protein